jgi:hypothetical protein
MTHEMSMPEGPPLSQQPQQGDGPTRETRIGVMMLLRFLVGDRDAILTVARDRNALWIGFVFVLSAGFAREYDGEDLLHEPWYLLLPLGASLLASFLVYVAVYCFGPVVGFVHKAVRLVGVPAPAEEASVGVGFWAGYLSFLGLFWMTAPLAWLYAVPYERFLSANGAAAANVFTLAVVAAWRVVLTIRIVNVCSGLSLPGAIFSVLLVVEGLGLVALVYFFITKVSVIMVMGGVRQGENPWPVLVFELAQLVLGGLALVMLGAGAVALFYSRGGGWSEGHQGDRDGPTWGMVGLAGLSLVVWVPILPLTQPEQQNRREFERAVARKEYQAAAEALNRPRDRFPPHWVPPLLLKSAYRHDTRQIMGILLALHEQGGPEWAVEVYEGRLLLMLEIGLFWSGDDGDVLLDGLPRFPLGRGLLEAAGKGTGKGDEGLDEATRRGGTSLKYALELIEQARRAGR